MTITSIPTKTSGDLGTVLTNVRAPVVNEFSAVNLEKIKDRVIEIFTEVGLSDGSTPGSVWEAILALAAQTIVLPIENLETITPGQAVAVSTVSGRCRRADAISPGLAQSFIGICSVGGVGDGGGTVTATIRASGLVTGLAGLTPNAPLYLSTAVVGGVTTTVPTGTGNLSLQIGWAVSATTAVIQPGGLPVIL